MRILALSEHFLPRVGGTVSYVVEICRGLVRQGHDVTLIVPGPAVPEDEKEAFAVKRIDVGDNRHDDLPRAIRYEFCCRAAEAAKTIVASGQADVVHVLFGLFLMEVIDTAKIQAASVPIFATVHNVPPMECRRSFNGDVPYRRLVDAARVAFVSVKNTRRLRAHRYNAYVVPSEQVRRSLLRRLPSAHVTVVGHGVSATTTKSEAIRTYPPPTGEALRLLTVGGFVPHKRQHLIPAVCVELLKRKVIVSWDVVGPAGRNAYYYNSVNATATALGLTADVLRLSPAVSAEVLAALYANAHLYVQPSTEEGFCLTALDAAALGIPVIGCRAGALPDIADVSGGVVVGSTVSAIAWAIENFADGKIWPTNAAVRQAAVRARWSWPTQVTKLVSLYEDHLIDQQPMRRP